MMMTRKIIAWTVTIVLLLLAVSCTQSCTRLETLLENATGEQDDPATSGDTDRPADVILEEEQNFREFLNEIQRMRRSRIENMSPGELRDVAAPLFAIKENSRVLSSQTLRALAGNHQKSGQDIRNMSFDEYKRWADRVERTIQEGSGDEEVWSAEDGALRNLLLELNESVPSETVCSNLFNRADNSVYLTPQENINVANQLCPGGTDFVLLPGEYSMATVESSRANNSWSGIGQVNFNGSGSAGRAFNGGLTGNTVRGVTISSYTEFAIYAAGVENFVVKEAVFSGIAVDKSGQSHGAVMLFDAEGVEITASEFLNVASSVRIVSSRGPLLVTENSALNSGRNFFQCDKCSGGGIRINRNSMEHTEQVGTEPLEDWINIYQSDGRAGDPIQVSGNRARGHSESKSGSFIMLGDSGGSHQVASGNIGVNPGQVGIGIAGGNNISVENNKMFSEAWEGSNVAFYSARYSEECGNHSFAPSGNVAHWRNSSGQLNRSWTDEQCGVTMGQIRSGVVLDQGMGPEIWDEWRR